MRRRPRVRKKGLSVALYLKEEPLIGADPQIGPNRKGDGLQTAVKSVPNVDTLTQGDFYYYHP